MTNRILQLFLLLLVLPSVLLRAQGLQENDPTVWPEAERSFLQDGPGLLLSPEQRTELRGFNPEARAAWIREFLAKDPVLREAVQRRSLLAADQYLSLQDARAEVLFLNGMPYDRTVVDCGTVFVPLEVWTYRRGTGPDGKPLDRQLVLYSPAKDQPYRLWLPSDSKRALYTEMMQYWLQQWEELRGKIMAVRFDIQNCKQTRLVDDATGVPGLTGALESRRKGSRIRPKDNSSFLARPADLAAWAREAAATELPPLPPELKGASAQLRFPERDGQRMIARTLVSLPPDAGFKLSEDPRPVARLVVEGLMEQEGKSFEGFRMRFQVPPAPAGQPLELAIDRPLRPGESFILRLRITDEVSGAQTRLARGFRVPSEPTPEPLPAAAAQGQLSPAKTAAGADSLVLLPPTDDVLTGIWRAEALVTGERIQKVTFLVDGRAQLTTTKKPYSTEVRLERFPTEQTVRAEGYDAEGKLVAADEVILNQPRGGFNVRIVSPAKGAKPQDRVLARAEVVVPEGRRIQAVEFKVNDQTVATMAKPPWQAEVAVPNADLVYLTVQATLDDGARAEAVRYLRSPQFVSEVEVNLVEMYVAVTDRSGDLVRDLKAEDFEVTEGGRKQEVVKFELVQNLPLTLGILIDTSGSMAGSMVETQKAATGFLESVMTPKDRAFAVSFARRPRLEMPPTDDVGAVVEAISGLQAVGDTALHDALVHSLYYFRGVQGQRALVLLSDGDDNASYMTYKDALEYAGRSGVAVYAIGLNLSTFDTSVKGKLKELAEATGGRAFWSDSPEDLQAIYKKIEAELRSRYLLAYNSTEANGQAGFRPVEVKVKKSGLKARAARGYFP
ncbi:MAG: VWA domain-containing protein [Thermoanaerobaculia bacterium]